MKSIKIIISMILFSILTANLITYIPTSEAAGTAPLDPIPSWLSSDSDWSYSTSWGDVNNDGYLDLAVGNYGQNDVYLNINGNIETTPSWTSTDSRDTYELAWGDVDNDGDQDLAAANFGIPQERNVMYFNRFTETGGAMLLETSPSWVSDEKHASRGLAFADLDKDGDIDLAVGNLDYRDRIYKNYFIETGGATLLETTPSWNSTRNSKAYKVKWGDMNNDGYLDLAVANAWKNNVVYLNINGVLETDPSWRSSDDDYTGCVAWGDVDNDGDLDLAAGNLWDINNNPTQNVIYYNINGMLESTPSWISSDITRTFGVAWGDVDNDGYLDLAAGNPGGVNTLYKNNNGTLETTPSWSSADSRTTMWLAWGDVDNDGDLDLAAPNKNWHQNVIYINNYDPSENQPPIADAGPDLIVNEGDIVQFDGSASYDPDGIIVSYEWDIDSSDDLWWETGALPDATGPTLNHIYGDNGIYTVTLRVTDDLGMEDIDTCSIIVNNVAPTITLMMTYPDDEGSRVTFEAESTDPGSDDITYSWALEYGPTIENLFYNNGVSPEPVYDPASNEIKSPIGTYPLDTSDVITHTYGDNGIYHVTLTVYDDDGGMTSFTTNNPVDNVAPIAEVISVIMDVEIGLRVAGRKYNDVGMTLYEDGTPIGYISIERLPGSPDEQMTWIPLSVDFSKSYSATVTFTPEDPPNIGANPVWIYLKSMNGSIKKIHHTFNVQQSMKRNSEHWNHVEPWEVELDNHFIELPFEITSHITDPGSDDIFLTYSYGFQNVTSTYLNNPPYLDPYPSPQINPRDIIETTQIAFEGPGALSLLVEDDDGGFDIVTLPIG